MTIHWTENPELPALLVKGRDVNWPQTEWLYCLPVAEPPPEFRAIYLGWFHADELVASGGLAEVMKAAAQAPVRAFLGPQRNGR